MTEDIINYFEKKIGVIVKATDVVKLMAPGIIFVKKILIFCF